MAQQNIPQEIQDWIQVVLGDNADDLLRYLRRRVMHAEDAADLLGQVMLTVWEHGARVPVTEEDARMWCFGIARNVVREHRRRATRHLALADRLRDHLHTSKQPQTPDTAAEDTLRAQTVRHAVRSLDERSRELVILVHWDGFSIAQAARILSMNESTARTRHSRALARLERNLAATVGENEGTSHTRATRQIASEANSPLDEIHAPSAERDA